MCDKLKWLSIIVNNLKTNDGKRLNQPREVAELLLHCMATFLLVFGHLIPYLQQLSMTQTFTRL